jgi:hypothetical protein
MKNLILTRPLLGFVVGTRAALAFGLGLILADRIPRQRRRAIALTLIGVGAATTIPAAKLVFGQSGQTSGEARPVFRIKTANASASGTPADPR